YTVWRQTNPLDVTQRVRQAGCPEWNLRDEPEYRLKWVEMCDLPALAPDGRAAVYLLNVKTSSTHNRSDGVNGYAVQAVSPGPIQPAVYAYSSMGMRNNIDAGEAKFYLAEV